MYSKIKPKRIEEKAKMFLIDRMFKQRRKRFAITKNRLSQILKKLIENDY